MSDSFSKFFGDALKNTKLDFNNFLESGICKNAKSQKKGRSTIKMVVLTLEELYTGTNKKMKVTRERVLNGSTTKLLELEIKPGWKAGTKITFEGEGDESVGDELPGDVVFEIEEKAHSRFQRDGSNLIHRKTISVQEALIGTKFTLLGIDGKEIEVDVTNQVLGGHDYEKVIANKGMPKTKEPGQFGHLRIRFDVRWPDHISPSQALAIKEHITL